MAESETAERSISAQIQDFDQRCSDEVERIRGARLRLLQHLTLGLLCSYLLLNALTGHWIGFLSLSFVTAICVLSAYMLRVRKRLQAASMLYQACLLISIVAGTVITGGLDSIAIWSLALVPATSACMFNTRGTASSLAATLLAFGLIAWIHHTKIFDALNPGTSIQEALILCAINIAAFALAARMISSSFSLSLMQIEEQRFQLDEAHQQAQVLNLAKAEFLARMSHELRTPMNGLLGVTQHLREKKLDPQDHQAVDIVHRCSENLLTMLNDVLDRSKVESTQLKFSKGPVDIALLLSDVSSLFLAKAKLEGIELRLDLQEQPFWVLTDATRIRQVISNLVGNALRYSDGGAVTVGLLANDNKEDPTLDPTFAISVKDQGIGMDREQVSRLFQDFEQVHADHEGARGGTGLGLAISKRLVDGLEGRIEVDSQRSQGSTFTVHLPLQRIVPPDVFDVETAKEQRPKLLEGRRVLLVDDGEINLKVAALALRKLGIESDLARDGAQAVQRVKDHRYDAVFMDIRMPVMNGLEATREIRRLEEKDTRIPIIALTAHAYREDERKALDAGMDAYISKPFKSHELESVLYSLLAHDSSSTRPFAASSMEMSRIRMPFPEPLAPASNAQLPSSLAQGPPTKHSTPLDIEGIYDQRLRFLIRIAVAAVIGYSFVSVWNQHAGRIGTDLLAISFYLTSEIIRRKSGRLDLARLFFMLGMGTSLFLAPMFGGHFESNVCWLYGLIPLATSHIYGPKSVLSGMAYAFAGLIFASQLAPLLPVEQELYVDEAFRITLIVTNIVVFGIIAVSSATSLEKQVRQLRRASVKLIRRRTEVDAATHSKGVFLANMSHEIRTPMNGILGMLQELKKQDQPGEHDDLVNTAWESGNRLLDTLNNILDFSKMEAGKLSLLEIEFHPKSVFDRIEQAYGPIAQSSGVELNIGIPQLCPPIVGDEARLEQVLSILVDNAIRFSDGGVVDVDVQAKPNTDTNTCSYKFSVRDQGVGISSEAQQRMFSEFESLEANSDHRSGIGLGLVLAKHLLELMQGSIQVTSALGQGTTFFCSLSLPMANPSALETRPLEALGRPISVLVVDDDPINRRVATLALERLDCEVEQSGNGLDAVKRAKASAFDLVLMDLYLPGQSGIKSAKQIMQGAGPSANARVVAFSGDSDPETLKAIESAGMHDILAKPFRDEQLVQLIERQARFFDNDSKSTAA